MRRVCAQCSVEFEITEDDLAFYDKVSPVFNGKKELIPPPTLCPDCRQQRRLVWRNERALYSRTSLKTGQKMVSIFSADKPHNVWHMDEWLNDAEPVAVGVSMQEDISVFRQFEELSQVTPIFHSYNIESQNSEFCNWTSYLKNCYLLASSNYNEDCYFGMMVNNSQNITDCVAVTRCEVCYECVDCLECHHCLYCTNAIQCSDSYFLTD